MADKWIGPIITGVSANHFREAQKMLASTQKVFSTEKIVFYDLGLENSQADFVKKLCNLVYRKFNFAKYPSHVRSLKEYRMKAIIWTVSKCDDV